MRDAKDGTGEVAAIYARQHAWGTGVGRLLMEQGLDRLARRGFTEGTLWVLETNDRARRFYAAGGWTIDDRVKEVEMGGTAVTEVRYRRALPS